MVLGKNQRNYYRILHVQPDAPAAVIRSSYRALMLKLQMHPDHGGEHWSAALINEAYEVLSDPERRAAYDRDLPWGWAAGRSARGPHDPGSVVDHRRCVFCGTPVPAAHADRDRCGTCDSPLTLVAKADFKTSDRRRLHRIPMQGALQYCSEWPQRRPHAGVLEDLSPNGIRFAGEREMFEFQILKIVALPLVAVARVVHCGPSDRDDFPHSIGADFYTTEFRRTTGTFISTRV